MYVRKSVYSMNGGDFGDCGKDDILYWYARGVGKLQERLPKDKTSWAFFAGIHRYDKALWAKFGYTYSPDQLPDDATQKTYWGKCEHGTDYFLPWHRGYLISLEEMIRDAVISLDGPSDWALPYWNYSDKGTPYNARELPPAFARTTLPDNKTANPLYTQYRDRTELTPADVNLDCLKPIDFLTSIGFSDQLDNTPHGAVHDEIGGLMESTRTSALDPIFYFHHSNIDRLWVVWINANNGRENPATQEWLNGKNFNMPMLDKEGDVQRWGYTSESVTSTSTSAIQNIFGKDLSYEYDDTTFTITVTTLTQARLEKLRNAAGKPNLSFSFDEEPMSSKNELELIGANEEKITVIGKSAISTDVHLDREMLQKTDVSFATAFDAESDVQEPDHIYLTIEKFVLIKMAKL